MTRQDFQASQRDGVHSRFVAFAGEWQGTIRVWFEPGEPSDVAAIAGTIRLILGGRFVLHEYEAAFMGKPQHGLAIYGYHLDRQRYEAAWIDSGHNGTAIMFSESEPTETGPLNVRGTYGGHDGGEAWGWRTQLEGEKNRLLITMYNITPQGKEAKAVEIDYARR